MNRCQIETINNLIVKYDNYKLKYEYCKKCLYEELNYRISAKIIKHYDNDETILNFTLSDETILNFTLSDDEILVLQTLYIKEADEVKNILKSKYNIDLE